MGILKWVGLAAGVGSVVVSYILYREMQNGYNKSIQGALDKAVYEKFGAQTVEARTQLTIAKADAQKLYSSEIQITKDNLLTNAEYQQAKAIAEANKSQIDVLKKNLRVAQQGNSTQVAVGSGNSAVAVSIKDTAQITQLQSDISRLEAEMRVNQCTSDTIWKAERARVEALRTADDKAIISAVKDAEKNYNSVKFEKEMYKNNLREDENFMFEVQNKAYLANFKPFKVILSSALLTLPVIVLSVIEWVGCIRMVRYYLKLKKGV